MVRLPWRVGTVGLRARFPSRRRGKELRRRYGLLHAYDAHYIDIVPDVRIIYAYEMKLGESRISASLTTVAFEAEPGGTRMVFTEQVVFR